MLPSPVQSALDTFSAALAAALGGTVTPTPAPTAPDQPWRPTVAQSVAFAARIGWPVADLDGDRQANAAPATPEIGACDGTPKDAWVFGGEGFDPSGHRILWDPAQREGSRKMCDRIVEAPTGDAANTVARGAGDVEPDYACFLVMQGELTGGGLEGTPILQTRGFTTTAQWLSWWMAATPPKPNAPGPGIATPA